MNIKRLEKLVLIRIGIFKLEEKTPTINEIYDVFASIADWKRNIQSSIIKLAEKGHVDIVDKEIKITDEGIDEASNYVEFFDEICGSDNWIDIIEYLLKEEEKNTKKKTKKKDTKKSKSKPKKEKKTEKDEKEILEKDEPIEL